MQLAGDCHERFKLAQLHSQKVPRATILFGPTEQCLSELPLSLGPAACEPDGDTETSGRIHDLRDARAGRLIQPD